MCVTRLIDMCDDALIVSICSSRGKNRLTITQKRTITAQNRLINTQKTPITSQKKNRLTITQMRTITAQNRLINTNRCMFVQIFSQLFLLGCAPECLCMPVSKEKSLCIFFFPFSFYHCPKQNYRCIKQTFHLTTPFTSQKRPITTSRKGKLSTNL